jgi:hypothetical protein
VRVAGLEPDSVKSFRPDALVAAADGEAEWLLDVLQGLVEFQYVQPARLRRKRYAIEERLAPPAAPAESATEDNSAASWAAVEEDATAVETPSEGTADES